MQQWFACVENHVVLCVIADKNDVWTIRISHFEWETFAERYIV